MRVGRVSVNVVVPGRRVATVRWLSAPLRSSVTWVVSVSVMTQDDRQVLVPGRGPSMRMAMLSKTCGTVSAPMRSADAAVVGVPNWPWRSSCAPDEERVAPGAVLGAEAELLERVGLERCGPSALVLVGEQDVVEHLDGPAVVAVVVGLSARRRRAASVPPIAAT